MYIIAPSPKLNSSPFQTGSFCPQNWKELFSKHTIFTGAFWLLNFEGVYQMYQYPSFLQDSRGFFGLATHIGGGNKNAFQIVFYLHPEPWGNVNPIWRLHIFHQRGLVNQPQPPTIDVCFIFNMFFLFFSSFIISRRKSTYILVHESSRRWELIFSPMTCKAGEEDIASGTQMCYPDAPCMEICTYIFTIYFSA